MINKAQLNPWLRTRMERLLEEGRRAGVNPHVSSAFRDLATQQKLFEECQTGRGVRGFPVKRPECSQHVWGFAFDMVAGTPPVIMGEPIPAPGSIGIPAIGRAAICAIFPDVILCGEERSTFDQRAGQFVLGLLGKKLGLQWNQSDSVHFAVFPAAEWDAHMTSVCGVRCDTCTHPGGAPF